MRLTQPAVEPTAMQPAGSLTFARAAALAGAADLHGSTASGSFRVPCIYLVDEASFCLWFLDVAGFFLVLSFEAPEGLQEKRDFA